MSRKRSLRAAKIPFSDLKTGAQQTNENSHPTAVWRSVYLCKKNLYEISHRKRTWKTGEKTELINGSSNSTSSWFTTPPHRCASKEVGRVSLGRAAPSSSKLKMIGSLEGLALPRVEKHSLFIAHGELCCNKERRWLLKARSFWIIRSLNSFLGVDANYYAIRGYPQHL